MVAALQIVMFSVMTWAVVAMVVTSYNEMTYLYNNTDPDQGS